MRKLSVAPLLLVAVLSMASETETGTTDAAALAQRYENTFRELDTNEDEMLTEDEAAIAGLAKEDFDSLDQNADSRLALNEFMQLLTNATGSFESEADE